MLSSVLFFHPPSYSHPHWRSFKSHWDEENATTPLLRDDVTRFYSRLRTRDVHLVRTRRFSITDKHNIAITSLLVAIWLWWIPEKCFLPHAKFLFAVTPHFEFSVYKEYVTTQNDSFFDLWVFYPRLSLKNATKFCLVASRASDKTFRIPQV